MNILTIDEQNLFKDSITDLYDTFSQFNKYGASILVRNVATENKNALGKGTTTYTDYTLTAVVREAEEVSKNTTLNNSIQSLDVGLLEQSDYLIKVDTKQTNAQYIKKTSLVQLNASELVNRILVTIIGLVEFPDRIFLYCKKQAR